MSAPEHDVIVIGAGVAGLTAGFVAARQGLRVLIIDRAGVGGQIVNIEHIDNFPGFPEGISGIELGPALQEQAETAGAEFLLDEVETLERDGQNWVVRCASASASAPAVILATGSALRKLEVPGEDALTGHGVSHCASCDGPFFRNEHVIVAGGGDSAVQEALVLATHARAITLVFDGPGLTAQKSLTDRLADCANISLLPNARIKEIRGEKTVQSVVLTRDTGEEVVEAGGVFVFIGLSPNTALAGDLVERDEDGRLRVDAGMRLSQPGLYAAGDVRAESPSWLASVAGDGATAALSVFRDLGARADR